MKSDTRRFYICLLATTFAAMLLLPLASLLWPRSEVQAASHHPGIKLLTLALPTVAVPRPEVRTPHDVKIKPKRRVVKPRKPGVRKRVSVPASLSPAAASAASTHMPVQAAKPLAKGVKPALIPAPAEARVPIVPVPERQAALPQLEAAAPVSNSSSAGGSAGKGEVSGHSGTLGNAEGNGRGGGGEPFGVGAGMTGLGGPRHVVYVLDISGSMTSRIARAREELVRALKGLSPNETFDIVVFSDEAVLFASTLSAATPARVSEAIRFLSVARVEGGTNLEAAMRAALGLDGVNEVVLVTDGVPTLGETDFGKLASEIQQRNRNNAQISAIGLLGRNPDGTDDSFEAEDLLRRVARESGGYSKIVPLGTKSP